MLGVMAFYAMLIDSHVEKKLSAYIITIIPRFNKRAIYYLGKLVNFSINTKNYR
jgi:hypothetical protein